MISLTDYPNIYNQKLIRDLQLYACATINKCALITFATDRIARKADIDYFKRNGHWKDYLITKRLTIADVFLIHEINSQSPYEMLEIENPKFILEKPG